MKPSNREDAQRLLEVPHCPSQVVVTEPIWLFLDLDNTCMEIVSTNDGTEFAKREYKP